MFKDGSIEGVIVRHLKKHSDERGWLMEVFRQDELPERFFPAMSYLSSTRPGVARGPHEHLDQVDLFCFAGPSEFRIYLWDNRESSATYRNRMIFTAGVDSPAVVVIPAKVVHAYKNIGEVDGLVVNCPNRLFMGHGRAEPVDEVRYEDDDGSPFKVD